MSSNVGASWDEEYRRGRYVGEAPLAFADDILRVLRERPRLAGGPGLYVGCGNGRNFLPLLDAGLDLHGLDVSAEALHGLARQRPDVAGRLVCEDFRRYEPARRYGYIVAIQVFQHGTAPDAAAYFRKSAELLEPGGLLFVRVNSAGTQIHHRHTVIERDTHGGLTIRYDEGPKRGLAVHFYARAELAALAGEAFLALGEPREDIIARVPPMMGHWAQWEMAWERR